LNGIRVKKHIGIIRWIGILDESATPQSKSPSTSGTDTDSIKKKKKKKTKKDYGIELIQGEGNHDGTHNGKRLFFTKDDAKTGVFIKRIDFRRDINAKPTRADKAARHKAMIKDKRRRRQRNNAQMYGNNMDDVWNDRLDIFAGDGGVQHKLGPREIGRGHYKGIDFSEEELERERAQKKAEKEKRKKEEAAADLIKLGPRDMGKIKYKGTKYEDYDDSELLSDAPRTKAKEITDEDRAQLRKAGPRDYGKNRYKGLKFDDEYIRKLRAKNQAKKEEEKRKALEEEKRLRAEYDVRNISRPQNWKKRRD